MIIVIQSHYHLTNIFYKRYNQTILLSILNEKLPKFNRMDIDFILLCTVHIIRIHSLFYRRNSILKNIFLWQIYLNFLLLLFAQKYVCKA